MCRINFNIEWQDLDSGLIFDHEGQYRETGTGPWIPFDFDFDNPQTPFINEIGDYQMRIRIFDGKAWSDWYYTNFQIGCGAFTVGFSKGFNS